MLWFLIYIEILNQICQYFFIFFNIIYFTLGRCEIKIICLNIIYTGFYSKERSIDINEVIGLLYLITENHILKVI